MLTSIALHRQTNIYLYGGRPAFREKLRRSLAEKGYRCPLEINSETICAIGGIPEDAVAVICLADGTKHEDVAAILNDHGFTYILYLPTRGYCSAEKQRIYRCAYNDFCLGYLENLPIPRYERNDEICHEENVIRQRERHISFWCGGDYIKTPLTEAKTAAGETPIVRLEDRKIYVSLFRFLAGEDVEICDYLAFECPDKQQWERYIENRKRLNDLYTRNFKYNMSFFEDSPSKVYWNEAHGCFIIEDGHHRIYFLKQNGLDRFPVLTTMDDFFKYRRYKYETASNVQHQK